MTLELTPFIVGMFMTVLYFCFTFGVDFLNSMFDLTVLQKQTDKTPSFYNLPFGSLALLARFLPIDMPAIMLSPKSYAIAIISISLGLPLLLILIFRVCKLISEGDLFVLLVMLITIVFAVSHAAVGAITEMNSYPCIFFTVCLLLPTLNPILGNKLVYPTSIVFYLIASVITGIHKYSIIIDSNRQADIIVESIIQQTKKIPDNVYIMLIDNTSLGHDIYQPIPALASGGGRIMRKIWNKWDMHLDIDSYQINTNYIELVTAVSI